MDDHDNGRDEFLGELPGPVIIGTVGDDRREAISPVPGPDQHVG